MGSTPYLQFNPSTLKASYNTSTGKAQVVLLSCFYCVKVPRMLQVTFADIENCGCQAQDEPGDNSRSFSSNLTTVLNGTFEVPFLSSREIFPNKYCKWKYVGECSVTEKYWPDNRSCSGETIFIVPYDEHHIEISLNHAAAFQPLILNVLVWLYSSTESIESDKQFSFVTTTSVETIPCFDDESFWPRDNQYTDISCSYDGLIGGVNGTVSIEVV